ncbi:uncharacterized protein A1O9_12402 [Exophiala aquamarina CBS 119918]|uniref:Short-chain dehydrogenase n=1 Tax=Exophiala aquamarina CBS 119918 TaxID=1182545 RepID=A0A072P7A5_9EURO|nr:uncharacterized protein A1O9_12402 [Exophiala aquamarina CBS 119918]KEF51485.1 hypothetical protein A1O9_12402 [Exophiala aquamarina CBS 119918]
MAYKLLVILGAGPGLGLATALEFASKGFDIALLSRNSQRLESDVATVQVTSPLVKVQAFKVDVGDHVALKNTLQRVETEMGIPEVVYYNAARVQPSRIGDASPQFMLEDFKSMNIGMYVAATWALPHLNSVAQEPGTRPSFLFGNSGIYEYPISDFFSLSMQKAAQTNFAGSFSQIAGPKGIHVASVNIGGIISDGDPEMNAKLIASKLWELYSQDKDNWSFEVKVGDIRDLIKRMSGQ